jgi:hypothetical protein
MDLSGVVYKVQFFSGQDPSVIYAKLRWFDYVQIFFFAYYNTYNRLIYIIF